MTILWHSFWKTITANHYSRVALSNYRHKWEYFMLIFVLWFQWLSQPKSINGAGSPDSQPSQQIYFNPRFLLDQERSKRTSRSLFLTTPKYPNEVNILPLTKNLAPLTSPLEGSKQLLEQLIFLWSLIPWEVYLGLFHMMGSIIPEVAGISECRGGEIPLLPAYSTRCTSIPTSQISRLWRREVVSTIVIRIIILLWNLQAEIPRDFPHYVLELLFEWCAQWKYS